MHKSYSAEMTILEYGIAQFNDETMSDEARTALIGPEKSIRFRNDQFKSYDVATRIIATFRVSDTGRRFLVSVKESGKSILSSAMKADPEKKKAQFDTFVDDGDLFYQAPTNPEEARFEKMKSRGFYVSPEAALTFTTAALLLNLQPLKTTKILMTGGSGYGKTTTPRMFAKAKKMDFHRMNCASIRNPEEWFGHREAVAGTTTFVPSEFIRKLVAGNLVMILDEYNRLEPYLHNTLYPLLDDDQATTIYDQRFTIGPNVLIVGTINRGYQFTGTFELDAANLRRFNLFCEVGPMPLEDEIDVLVYRTNIPTAIAKDIVTVAQNLRQLAGVECSTATTLELARVVRAGIPIRDAFEMVVIMRAENTEDISDNPRKLAMDVVNAKLGPFKFQAERYDLFNGLKYED